MTLTHILFAWVAFNAAVFVWLWLVKGRDAAPLFSGSGRSDDRREP